MTRENLLHYLRYDSSEGKLYWENPPRKVHLFKGKEAGTPDVRGYKRFKLHKKIYKVHRVIYFLEMGVWSDKDNVIDHINGDKLDNRIENLRIVSTRENVANKEINRDGHLPGTYYDKESRRWWAQFGKTINGTPMRFHLGAFDTQEAAHAKYKEAILASVSDDFEGWILANTKRSTFLPRKKHE